jgi:hypothetical protein
MWEKETMANARIDSPVFVRTPLRVDHAIRGSVRWPAWGRHRQMSYLAVPLVHRPCLLPPLGASGTLCLRQDTRGMGPVPTVLLLTRRL